MEEMAAGTPLVSIAAIFARVDLQWDLVVELDLLAGFIHMHDLVDDLERRLAVVNLAVMHFLWLAPAAIKQNLGRHNPRHRRGGLLHHYAGQRFDGCVGV